MTFCGLTWYIKHNDLSNDIEEDLEELLEEIQAEKVSRWNVTIIKSSNNNSNFKISKNDQQEMFYIEDNQMQNAVLVQKTHNNSNAWGFEGDFRHLSKTLNVSEEMNIRVKGHTYKFSDFELSFGKITKNKNVLRDKLIKVEFKAVNKFEKTFQNYRKICPDFFESISEDLSQKLEVDKMISKSSEFVANLFTSFKAMESEKLMFSEKYSGLILLNCFDLL